MRELLSHNHHEDTVTPTSCSLQLSNRNMLHARPSAKVTKIAQAFQSQVYISYGNRKADAKQAMNLILLWVTHWSEIKIECVWIDANEAIEELKDYFQNRFPLEDVV